MRGELDDRAVPLGAAPELAVAVHPRVRPFHGLPLASLDRSGYAFTGDLTGEAQLPARPVGLIVVLEVVSTGLIIRLTHVMSMVERLVPDGLWELFQRVVPAPPVRPQGGGRRRYGDRQVLAAIVFVATTGCTWRQLPLIFGPSGPTAHLRFTEWNRARVWGKLHRLVLDELGARGELDWSRCAIDSVNMRALKGGTLRVRIP